MTEAEWLVATAPMEMLECLGNRVSERKLRLFAVACCRLSWDTITEAPLRRGIELAEKMADGCWDEEQRVASESAVLDLYERELGSDRGWEYDPTPTVDVLTLLSRRGYVSVDAARCSAAVAHWAIGGDIYTNHREFEADLVAEHAAFMRDIFGPVGFRTVAFNPAWLTSSVRELAAAMYASGDFSWMPILADALQDAGCDNDEILDHCRRPGEHVRGCWVVDLVLVKT